MPPIKVLLQTTIPVTVDDWSIARFSSLATFLSQQRDGEGAPLFDVTARDRDATGAPDRVLSTLDHSDFDEMWLFAVDTGDGLTAQDCEAISRFRRKGGGLLVTRDHMDLGSSVCSLAGVGKAHHFHSHNLDPDADMRRIDDIYTTYISWPNFHSGFNGDFQAIAIEGPVHPILADPSSPTGAIRFLPSHPHEGAVTAPEGENARVIARGTSKVSGRTFNIAVAFEPGASGGPAIAQSTFHHFADYNWDSRAGAPSFVDEPPGDGMAREPNALADTHRYVRNAALWLARRLERAPKPLGEPSLVATGIFQR
jgi:hypothetical protein